MNTEMLPLVSIVVPCYNHENYIQKCIQSIIDQDYENIELIIIDDGSVDLSVDKIKEMLFLCRERFSRFEFRARSNRGLCATLNESLEWVNGLYFSSIASDDTLINTKVSTLVTFMLRHPEVGAAFGGMNVINDEDRILYVEKQSLDHKFNDLLMRKNLPYAPAGLLRTNIVREVGGYSEKVKIEDWYMWLMMSYRGIILRSFPQVVANYRRHDDNYSSKLGIMHEEQLEVLKFFKNEESYPKALKHLKYIGLRSLAKEAFLYSSKEAFSDKDLSFYHKFLIFVVGLTPRPISTFICDLLKKV